MSHRFYLGVDPAQANCGYSILKVSEDGYPQVVFSKTEKTPDEHKSSDATILRYQSQYLKKVLASKQFNAICMEAPTMGKMNNPASIGTLHGAFINMFFDYGKPFMWIPPTKVTCQFLTKEFLGKQSAKTTKEKKIFTIKYVKQFFDIALSNSTKCLDSNMADSMLMAYLAFIFDMYIEEGFKDIDLSPFCFTKDMSKIMKNNFCSSKRTSKLVRGKEVFSEPQGILNRLNDFYYIP